MDNFYVKTPKGYKKDLITFQFTDKLEKESFTYALVLGELLIRTNNKLKTVRETIFKENEMYVSKFSTDSFKRGNYYSFCFFISTLSDQYSEGINIKDKIDFLKDFIFDPNIEDNKFNEKEFKIAKGIVLEEIKEEKENKRRIANTKMRQLLDPNSSFSFESYGNEEILKEMTNEKLYEFYKNLIEKAHLDVFITGDFDEKLIEYNDKRFLNDKKKKLNKEEAFYIYGKEDKGQIIEEFNGEQSYFNMVLEAKDLTYFEKRYVAVVFSKIFGGGASSKLFEIIREKNSLCYYVGSRSEFWGNMVFVSAGLDGKNYDKFDKLLNEVLNGMKNGDFTEEKLKIEKDNIISNLKSKSKTLKGIHTENMSISLLDKESYEEIGNNIEKVTKKDVIDYTNKLNPIIKHLYKGVK